MAATAAPGTTPRRARGSLADQVVAYVNEQVASHALKPGASVGIVDAFGPTAKHGTPPELLRCELGAVGYREIKFDRLRGSDAYLAVFAPPSTAGRTQPEAIVACKRR